MFFVLFKLYWFVLIPLIITGLQINTTNDDQDKNIEDEPNDDYSFLVVGGYRPKRHFLAKYIVSLREGRLNKYKGDNHYCGGSIISPKVILTAAHCVVDAKYNPAPKVITVVAGTPYLHKVYESARAYAVQKTITHPVFSFKTMRSDIALIILKETIDLNRDTRTVLPLVDSNPTSGTECISLGWGRIFPGGPRPTELVYVNLSLMKRSECSGYYPMNPSVICAADADDKEKGVWKGDSGGPLICGGKLAGVVSFGFPKDDAPSFFSNVYEHRKWILENSGNRINLTRSNFLFILIFVVFGAVLNA